MLHIQYEVKGRMNMTFTHLQVRSGYSFYESTLTIEKLVKRAKQLNFRALALTDEAVLHGAISFIKICEAHDIKPIIGMIVNVKDESFTHPLVLLAKNNTGYKNLLRISTAIQLNEEQCTYDWLASFTEGLIGILSTEAHRLRHLIVEEKISDARQFIANVKRLFHPDDFYIGVEKHNAMTNTSLEAIKRFIKKEQLQATALHDVRYLKENDYISYDCLQQMKHNESWKPEKISPHIKGRHLRSSEEMESNFSLWPELITETNVIANKCTLSVSFDEPLLPRFPTPDGKSAYEYLVERCRVALREKITNVTEKVQRRMEHELRIIKQLGFSDYFLIVADFVQYAKRNGILVGPGRGSAAGSLIAYLLGITNVNPLDYDLLFERFLNPERVSLPDIDIDFSDVRRDEVIEYVRKKYGSEYVAQIVTFGTFTARSLVRELMKTMNIDGHDQKYILQHIPVQANKPLITYIKQDESFREYIKQSPQLRTLFRIALTLEGLPRHVSTHAAGIVIGKYKLIEHVPLMKGTAETNLTQFAMDELEAIGLLKIDILGLRNLTLIERIVQSIQKATNRRINIDALPEKDERTFRLLRAGRTNGVFQLESQGMKRVLKGLRPTSIDDIIALNALYRPGPMEHIPTYINRKHGREQVTYLHEDLKPILESTYGVIVYQEQIMQISNQFANLSYGEADILRRAISKKDHELIEKQRETFINGCMENGYEQAVANKIFSLIVKFADYGFNKSHSVAYSKIAYQLAYLKAHYPTFFFAHLLGSVINDAKKLTAYVREANEFGIEILPPSINKSHAYFTVEGKNIRIGLMAIKGIGLETVKQIIAARKSGPFRDLFDFCLRVSLKRNALETLILAGTFDETYDNRASLLASIDQALERAELFGSETGQANLFADQIDMKPAYVEMEDFSPFERLRDEKELLSIYISNHPLKQYRTELAIRHYSTLFDAKERQGKQPFQAVVNVERIKKITTRRGEQMAFITLMDETDELDGVIFPNVFRNVSSWLKEDRIVQIEGQIEVRKGEEQVIIHDIKDFSLDTLTKTTGFLYVKVLPEREKSALPFLEKVARENPGATTVILHNARAKKTYKLSEKYNVAVNENMIQQLQRFFGQKHVVFKQH